MTDAEQAELKAKVEGTIKAVSLMSVMAGFGLGGIVGTLCLGVLAGCALSVFCASLCYVACLLVLWARPTLVAPKRKENTAS